MKIIGKYMGNDIYIENKPMIGRETSVCLHADSVYASPYSNKPDEVDFFITILSGTYIWKVKKTSGDYLSKQEANAFLKIVFKNELIDLKACGLAFVSCGDRIPEEVNIRNSYDPFSFDPIPITVCSE